MGAGSAGVLLVCSAALLAGCNVDLSGLNDLWNPDPTYLKLPGRRVAAGEFSNVSIGGDDAEGAYVVANERAFGTRTLTITPFEGSLGCNAGPSDRSWQFGIGDHGGMALSFMLTTDEVAHLHVVSPSCEELLPPIESDSLPLENVFGHLVLERDGDLVLLEPWDRKQRTLARGVREIVTYPTLPGTFWTLESPQDDLEDGALGMVARDERFKVIGRIDDVQEFAIAGAGTWTETGYVENWGAAYVQNDELHLALTPDLEPSEPIDSDVCGPSFAGSGISYFSPCDSRTLNFYGGPGLSREEPGTSGEKYVLKPGVVGVPVFLDLEGREGVLLATSDGAEPETITLWGGLLGEELEPIGEAPFLDGSIRVWTSGVRPDDELELFTDVVGNVGRLVRWKPGSPVRQIASGVTECQRGVCLVNFDGETGDAVSVSQEDGSVQKLASRVPRGGIGFLEDSPGLVLITDYDAEARSGTLVVESPVTQTLEQIATGVPISGYRSLRKIDAIAYLRDFDPEDGTGVIGIRVLSGAGDTFETGVRASEFQEVGWPRPGLLYVVPNGAGQGIWFADLR